MKHLNDTEITRREEYVLDTLSKVVVANTRILFNTADLDCALVNIQRAFDKATTRKKVNIVFGHPVRVMNDPDWVDRYLPQIADEMKEWDFENEPYFPLTATEMENCAHHIGIDTRYILEDSK